MEMQAILYCFMTVAKKALRVVYHIYFHVSLPF